MTDIILKAPARLDDPLMVGWAIRQYERLPIKSLEARQQMQSAWFHELFLAKLIEDDDTEHLPMLFRVLPPECFANLTHLIVKKWPLWPGRIAGMAAPVLATNDPDQAFELYDTYLQRVDKGAGLELERFTGLQTLLKSGTYERRKRLLDLLSRYALRLPDTDF